MRKPAETIRATTGRPLLGFTMLELLVVLAIILFVTASVVGGYSNMQKAQRLNTSVDRVINALNLARSTAISRNAVCHVRIINTDTTEQAISVQSYTNTSTALQVRLESDATNTGPNAWSPTSGDTLTKVAELERYAVEAETRTPPDTVLAENYRKGKLLYYNPVTTQPYNNYRVEYLKLQPQVWFGVQSAALSPPLLFFYPDGSASVNTTFFVTENEQWRDSSANSTRGDAFTKGQANLRMVRVFQGGMIKQLNQRRGDKMP